MKTPTRIAVIASLAILAGCGFALRGSDPLPDSLERTYIESGRQGLSLARELERQLEVSGAQLVASDDDATAVIKIRDNDTGQRILSVTTTGGPEEYEVYHIVRYEVDVDGRRVYGPKDITLTRDYTFDKNDVLGKRQEFDTLTAALRKDMASLILRRLRLAPEMQ